MATLISKLFAFALVRDLAQFSPAVRIARPGVEKARDGVLTESDGRHTRRDVTRKNCRRLRPWHRRRCYLVPLPTDIKAARVARLFGFRLGVASAPGDSPPSPAVRATVNSTIAVSCTAIASPGRAQVASAACYPGVTPSQFRAMNPSASAPT